MNPVPESLMTERLQLRRPLATDAADVFAYAGDPDVTRFMDWPIHTSQSSAAAWIDECAFLWRSGAEFTWFITPQPQDQVIGLQDIVPAVVLSGACVAPGMDRRG